MPEQNLNPTSYALLGQLALRPWSIYEMTRNVARTLHWFWPRAESVLYTEIKKLAALGYVRSREEPGSRGRPRTIYAITPAGRRALRRWLATASGGFTLHCEPVLRVHLAPYGSLPDLTNALDRARDEAEALLRQALVIGSEFAEQRHQFQDQVHVRALLFDYLWNFGLSMYVWADRAAAEVARWPDIDGDDAARHRATQHIASLMASHPLASNADAQD